MMSDRPTVSRYMTRELVKFSPDLEVNHAVAQLLDRGISGAPVVDESGMLIGILTAKDCFKAVLGASYYQEWGGVVGDYMSRNVHTMDADLDIIAAADQFLASPYRRFPTMQDRTLVGIISRSDLLRAFTEQRERLPAPYSVTD